jgi:hypothetical protein
MSEARVTVVFCASTKKYHTSSTRHTTSYDVIKYLVGMLDSSIGS